VPPSHARAAVPHGSRSHTHVCWSAQGSCGSAFVSVGASESQPLEVHADRSILICQFEYLIYIYEIMQFDKLEIQHWFLLTDVQ